MKRPLKRTAVSEITLDEAWRRWKVLISMGDIQYFSTVVQNVLNDRNRPHSPEIIEQYIKAIRKEYREYRTRYWYPYLS